MENIETLNEQSFYDLKGNQYLNLSVSSFKNEEHLNFLSSIGFIINHVALIEENIKGSIKQITGEEKITEDITKRKNLGSLIEVYQLILLATHDKTVLDYGQPPFFNPVAGS